MRTFGKDPPTPNAMIPCAQKMRADPVRAFAKTFATKFIDVFDLSLLSGEGATTLISSQGTLLSAHLLDVLYCFDVFLDDFSMELCNIGCFVH